MSSSSNGYLFNIMTIQTNILKTLFEALKEIITDVNVIISDQGIKLISVHTGQTILIHLKLDSSKFDYFKCAKPTVIGVNMINLHKLMKTASNDDTTTFYILESQPNELIIQFDQNNKKRSSKKKLKLLDLDIEQVDVPPAEFECVISMPSVDFQKVCRDHSIISDNIEIKSIGNKLIFASNGDIGESISNFGECGEEATDGGLKYTKSNDPSKLIQGKYNLKHLISFSKCASLCHNVEIMMKNNFPIIISYTVGNLGKLRLALAPMSID